MKNKLFSFLLLVIVIFFAYELVTIYLFLEKNPRPVLSTPYGILMVSLSPELSNQFFYYRPYELNLINPPEFSNWWFAFSPIIAAIVFFLLSCLYILLFAKIRRIEGAFLLFAAIISMQYISFFDFIGRQLMVFLYYFTSLLSNIGFLHLFSSFINRKLPWWFKFYALGIIASLAFLYFPDSSHEEIKMFKILGAVHISTFLSSLGLMIYDELHQRKRYTIKNRNLRRFFSFASLSIIFIPSVSYLLPVYKNIPASIYTNVVFYIPAVFPLVFLVLSLHNNYIFFKRPVKTWYLRLVYVIFYMFLYGIIIGFESQFIFSQKGIVLFYIGSVFAFIFIFDALRLFTQITVNFYLNYRKLIFEEHITDIFEYTQTPFQFEDGLNRFIKMTESGLGALKVTFLLNEDLFGEWIKEKYNIKLIKDDDPIWNYRRKRFLIRPKLLVSLKDKGYPELFLKKYSGVVLIFFPEFKSGIVLSEKTNQTPYISEDMKYIFDLVRQIEPVLQNYKLLIDNLETKKFNKELEIVSRVQKKHQINKLENNYVKLNIYSKPYRHVTGDYLDVYEISKTHILMFLGDVSGHGLASAYFTGLVRSLIDGSLQSGDNSVTEIFNLINSVLCSKQSSSSFMTMSAIDMKILRVKTRKIAEIQYINAGQHAPYLYLLKSKKMIHLADSQQVLGVFETNYHSSKIRIDENFRLILTSDGAFEIFNEEGVILGDQKFTEWVESTSNLSSEDQKNQLMQNIKDYSFDPEMNDDISILIADIILD
jgi:sigma-B regulation protein RsbU (phosphoserine phosphatase)